MPASSLRPGASNLLVVRVDNAAGARIVPQDWWNWGGIVGDVSLQPVGRLALSDLGVMPQLSCRLACGSLLVQGRRAQHVLGAPAGRVHVRVTSPSGIDLGHAVTGWGGRWRPARRGSQLPDVAAGPPGAVVPVEARRCTGSQVSTTAGDRVEQVNSLKVGMRTIKVSHGILYLNGKRLWLHGASIHEDVQGSGASMTEGDINTIVSQLRSVGANITRAHYALSEELLDALDQAGILVWSQPPIDHADSQLARPAGRDRALSLLRDTILGRAQPPVGGGRLGRQRALPDARLRSGHRARTCSRRSRSRAVWIRSRWSAWTRSVTRASRLRRSTPSSTCSESTATSAGTRQARPLDRTLRPARAVPPAVPSALSGARRW